MCMYSKEFNQMLGLAANCGLNRDQIYFLSRVLADFINSNAECEVDSSFRRYVILIDGTDDMTEYRGMVARSLID